MYPMYLRKDDPFDLGILREVKEMNDFTKL